MEMSRKGAHGTTSVPKRRCTVVIAACFLLVIEAYTSASNATEFCSDLQTVLNDAENKFKSLRGVFDFDDDSYISLLLLGDYSDCSISSSEGTSEFHCTRSDYDAPQDAYRAYNNTINAVRFCLGNLAKERRSSKNHYKFEYTPTGDDITVSYHSYVSRVTKQEKFVSSITVTFEDQSYQ